MRKQREIRRLRQEVRAMRKDLGMVKGQLDRYDRMDVLIKEMKQTAREMLLMSREL